MKEIIESDGTTYWLDSRNRKWDLDGNLIKEKKQKVECNANKTNIR